MKMNKLFTVLFLIGVTTLTVSCSDYLSKLPDNRTSLDNADKVAEVLTGAYPLSSHYYMTETMSDNVADRKTISSTTQLGMNLFTWEDPIDERGDTPTDYWTSCYNAIAQANYALAAIEEQSDGSDVWNHLKGEALLCRAYAHFMLVNLWGKHYNPATANSDLGVPYVTEPETELLKEYHRNTVQEDYDMIEDDMLAGIDLVGDDYESPKYHFTTKAAYALATRFYLFKGNEWDKVIEYADLALGNDASAKVRDWISNGNLDIYTQLARFASSEEPANILVADVYSTYDFFRLVRDRFGLDPDKSDELFRASNPYGKDWPYGLYGQSPNFFPAKLDEYFKYTNVSAGIGYVFARIVMFSYDEVLLARAEAYAMKGDFTSSLNDINTFLPKKTENYNGETIDKNGMLDRYSVSEGEYAPYYVNEMNNDQLSFIKGIAEMRRREYYGEGLRWFDIKRFHIKVTHQVFQGSEYVLEQDDNRRVFQIPNAAITQGIQANPR